jgi:hypothetical protein
MATPEYVVRYRWEEGDLGFWDNRTTMHYAIGDYGDAHRVIQRVTIQGRQALRGMAVPPIPSCDRSTPSPGWRPPCRTNGDVNPYGVAIVPTTIGHLVAGDTLVSNFNDRANVQGTGTTIVQITPLGSAQLFSRISHLGPACRAPAESDSTPPSAILPGGWVVVGSLPTARRAIAGTDPAGCLIILDPHGSAGRDHQ